jgi:hypothetical protein
LKTPDGKRIDITNGKTYYILKSGNSIDADIMYSFRTVEAENDMIIHNENASVSIYITDPNGTTKSFTRSRTNTDYSDFYTDSLSAYLKSGVNVIYIIMSGEGNKATGVPSSGLKDVPVI